MSVMVGTVDTLTLYAEQVRDVSAAALATTTDGVPDTVYVDSGSSPAYDCCPALIVYVDAINEAATSPVVPPEATARRVTLGAVVLATYIIDILRCAPGFNLNGTPTTAQKEAVAAQTQQDVWAVWNALRNAVRDGEIFTTCEGVHFDSARPVAEQGGCVGWEIQIRAMIPGIPG